MCVCVCVIDLNVHCMMCNMFFIKHSSLPSPSQSPTPPSELSDHNDVDGMMINDNEIQFLTKNNIQSSDIGKFEKKISIFFFIYSN